MRAGTLLIKTFGHFSVIRDGQPLPKLPTTRAQALLIYLLVEQAFGRPVHKRESLIELLWPGMPPRSGRKNLRQTLYYLRRSIPDHDPGNGDGIEPLFADRQELSINPDYPFELDAAEFMRTLDGPADRWPAAADLYQGDFLAGFSLADANPFEEWAAARRAYFQRRALEALERLAADGIQVGDYDQALTYARRQLELDNLRERAYRQLMEILALSGRREEAIAQYETCRRLLAEELDIEPLPETVALFQHIVSGDRLSQRARPGVGNGAKEEPKSVTVTNEGHNLPQQFTPLVGRVREVAELIDLLSRDPGHRLVTIVGPGGIGKTRLALETASRVLEAFPDGVFFVGLASIEKPALVPNAIARTLGVVEKPGQPLQDGLARFLKNKRVLLLTDNFEHLLEAAPLISTLLADAPRLTCLATSREALRLSGEYVYRAPALAVPDLKQTISDVELAENESVTLFLQRAQAVNANFHLDSQNAQAVAEICARLDGLPLAIELAAARVRVFSPAQLRERLSSRFQLLTSGPRDVPARQRTLSATIDWSYQLLEHEEQKLFSRLSVFVGGRSLEAVEQVCGPELSIDPIAGLESLLDKSLLYREEGPGGEPRYFMLETIQEYALQRLGQDHEEETIRQRHLEWFVSFSEAMESGHRRHGQLLAMDRTEAEIGNLRAALSWALASRKHKAAARLVAPLDYFLHYRARFVEGYQWVNWILALEEFEAIPSRYQLRLLVAASRLSYINGELDRCEELCQRILLLAKESDDRGSEAYALMSLSLSAIARPEEYESAAALCQESIAIYRELGDLPNLAQALTDLGEIARVAGRYDRAESAYLEALAISTEIGDEIREGMSVGNLAFVAYHEGDYLRAKQLLTRYLEKSYRAGSIGNVITGLASLAAPLAHLGEEETAAQLLGAASGLLIERGFELDPGDQPEVAAYIDTVRTMLDPAAFKAAWRKGQALSLDQAVALALEIGGEFKG